jgi:MAP/microtubule affinity-regulating kinase
MARDISDSKKKFAIKIMKAEYLESDPKAAEIVSREAGILKALAAHPHIVKLIDFGTQGKIVKASGKEKEGIVYLILEYVSGGLLFEIVEEVGSIGEDAARTFFKEIMSAIEYMQS